MCRLGTMPNSHRCFATFPKAETKEAAAGSHVRRRLRQVWAAQLNPRGLSQGDVLRDLPVGMPWVPLVFVSKNVWPRTPEKLYYPKRDALERLSPHDPNDLTGLFIARGLVCRALVINHSCDLDDAEDTDRIVVAPIWPLAGVSNPEARERIRAGARRTFVSLRDVPNAGDCYADLGSVAPVDRRLFTNAHRELSMTEEALLQLRAQIADYFCRLDPKSLREALKKGLAAENEPPAP